MLHAVNKSPFRETAMDQAIKFSGEDEPILLYEDAVYAAQKGTAWSPRMEELLKKRSVYALDADVKARGIETMDGVQRVDYGGFVDLVAEHNIQSWQ